MMKNEEEHGDQRERKWARERERKGGERTRQERELSFNNVLPGLANMLINGVNSEGLLRWAMCSLRPAGPGTPPV